MSATSASSNSESRKTTSAPRRSMALRCWSESRGSRAAALSRSQPRRARSSPSFAPRYPDVRFSFSYDQADLVSESFNSVRDAILLGLALAVAVVWTSRQPAERAGRRDRGALHDRDHLRRS